MKKEKKSHKRVKASHDVATLSDEDTNTSEEKVEEVASTTSATEDIWKEPVKIEEKDREEEFEDYLQDLFMWFWLIKSIFNDGLIKNIFIDSFY